MATAEEVLAEYGVEPDASVAPAPALSERPRIDDPPDNIVELPAGMIRLDMENLFGAVQYVTTAEVRELNGYDEEKLARIPASNAGRILSTILELGTVSIGDEEATPEVLEDLLVGDREALLVGIRIATYGSDIDVSLTCPSCGESQERSIDLHENLPVKRLENQSDRTFEVPLSKGNVAVVTLPTGRMQKALMTGGDKTFAQLNTELLAKCVQSINGLPLLEGTKIVLDMSAGDRKKLVKAIGDHAVGPQFGEVSLSCDECSEKISLPLNLTDMFLL